MTNEEYDKLAEVVQNLIDSPHWRASLVSITAYVKDPTKPVAPSVTENSRELVRFGRDNPAAFDRVSALIYRIKSGDVDIEAYIQANSKEIEKAFEFLNKQERPIKTINALVDSEGDPKKIQHLLARSDKKVLAVLLPIVKLSLTRFRKLVSARMIIKKQEIAAKGNEYLRAFRARQSKQKRLYCYINRVSVLDAGDKVRLKEISRRAALAADMFVEANLQDGESKYEARRRYWEEYDRDLDSTMNILDKEEKGAKINREFVTFPKIVDKFFPNEKQRVKDNKLNQLKHKFQRR